MRGARFSWPESSADLTALQDALALARPPEWCPPDGTFLAAGTALVSLRGTAGPGEAGETAFAGAALFRLRADAPREVATLAMPGCAGAPYVSGRLALREGPLLEAAVRALPSRPDLLVVHAAGRDHPRRAGLALMLGAALDVPSVGVTSRPLVAAAEPPGPGAGAKSPLRLGAEIVGYRVRLRAGVRPVVAHAGWRTSPETAAAIVLEASLGFRLPEPIRRALAVARAARAARQARVR